MHFKKYLAEALATCMLCMSPLTTRAQEVAQRNPVEQTGTSTKTNNKLKIGSFGLNATSYSKEGTDITTTLYTILSKGSHDSWFVYGQRYNAENGTNDADISFKFRNKDKKQFYRFTGTTRTNKNGDQKQSFGFDWDSRLFSLPQNSGLSFIGDIGRIENNHIDYGLGTKLTLDKNHNVFFIHSERGQKKEGENRGGYFFYTDKKLLSFYASKPENKNLSFTFIAGLTNQRLHAIYDDQNKIFDTGIVAAFNSNPLPTYTARDIMVEQLTYPRSVVDADYIHIFPGLAFLSPKNNKPSDVFRFNAVYNGKRGAYDWLWLSNAFMPNKRIVLTQNVDYTPNLKQYGGGIGYYFSPSDKNRLGLIPTFRVQKGTRGYSATFEMFFVY